MKNINGIRIAFLGYCGDSAAECKMFRKGSRQGPALLTKETVRDDIKDLNKIKVCVKGDKVDS